MRYVLEGEWSGYTSSQRHVVHREIITSRGRLHRLRELHAIRYTDGTTLNLSIREAKPREKIEPINSYRSLIRECEAMPGGVVNVADLPSTRKAS